MGMRTIKGNIYIPFSDSAAVGGPTTFMSNFRHYLDEVGYPYSTKHRLFARGIFFPVATDIKSIRRVKLFGGKAIQRLDGVFYPSQHGPEHIRQNAPIKEIYLNHSDFFVFQTDYCRKQCFKMLGEKEPDEYSIIINGADHGVFHPAADAGPVDDKVRFAMSGNFRKPAMIEPVVNALDEIRGQLDFEVVVAGPISGKGTAEFFERDYIRHLGPLSAQGVADMLRGSHVFLHSQINDLCPNAVIEAVSCGLPVVGFDGGSMSELLPFGRELLAHVSDDLIQKYEDYDYRRLKEKISLAVAEYPRFRQVALENAGRYDFKECGRRYVEVFDRVCGR
jgi:glycosyltransferase involved in cell wall biosynthesis